MLSIVGSRCDSSVAGYPDTPPTTASIIRPLLRSGRCSAESPQQTTFTDTRQVVQTASRFGSQTAAKYGEISSNSASAAAAASSGGVIIGGEPWPMMHLQARMAAVSADAAIAAIAASAAGEAAAEEEEEEESAPAAPAGGIAVAVATTALEVRAAAADACPAKLTVLSVEASARCPVVWQNPLSLG